MIEKFEVLASVNAETILPVVPTIAEAVSGLFYDPTENKQPKVILVVEDEAFVGEVMAEVLRTAGYISLIARNASEAFEARRSFRGNINLVIADMVMAGIGGRELASAFTKLCPGVRILLMSGYAEQLADDERYSFYLAKPFTSEMLLTKIQQVLEAESYTASAMA